MNRNIIVFMIVFLIFPCVVYSVTTFVIQETDKISLAPNASDPDMDALTNYYSPPLNSNGEWQTTYGYAGIYTTTLTVSDGKLNASKDVTIFVKRKEEPPKIELYVPKDNPVYINESDTVKFMISASDLNKDPLTYQWYLDKIKAKDGQEFSYRPSYNDSGSHSVVVIVSDGLFNVSHSWDVEVADLDIGRILNSIPGLVVSEGDIARLQLPDFARYGLPYTISSPVGNSNEWQTTYDDAGVYDVIVHAEGNGFKGDKSVGLTVKDADRPPAFNDVGNKIIDEGKPLVITLMTTDPDGDSITYSADNIPAGAKLEGNVFTWTPSYDTVSKEDFIDRIVDKFTVLSKSFYIQFAASSKGKKIVRNVVITVKDVNRQPVVDYMGPIIANEGDTIKIVPTAADPDGDKLSFSYSGFMSGDTYRSKFGDAGNHTVKVTASDGSLEASENVDVIIKKVDRPPVLSKIAGIKSKEGDDIAIKLDSYDPDGDKITYYADNAPAGSKLNGNIFSWTPPYDFVAREQVKNVDLVFTASDGAFQSSQPVRIEVSNTNRAPRIINASQGISGKINEQIRMFVKAVDGDNDPLTYTWDFGLLEKYLATSNHQRIFTTPGNKVVKVIVSDGIDSAEQIINVYAADDGSSLSDFFNGSVEYRTQQINITYRKETRIYSNGVVVPAVLAANTIQSQPLQSQQYVRQANSPPRIVDASPNLAAKVGQPVLMHVNAVDGDNDPLTYTWDFGLFDSHKGAQNHQRTFTSTGVKEVKVTVSDGHYDVHYNFNVNVAE